MCTPCPSKYVAFSWHAVLKEYKVRNKKIHFMYKVKWNNSLMLREKKTGFVPSGMSSKTQQTKRPNVGDYFPTYGCVVVAVALFGLHWEIWLFLKKLEDHSAASTKNHSLWSDPRLCSDAGWSSLCCRWLSPQFNKHLQINIPWRMEAVQIVAEVKDNSPDWTELQ